MSKIDELRRECIRLGNLTAYGPKAKEPETKALQDRIVAVQQAADAIVVSPAYPGVSVATIPAALSDELSAIAAALA